VRAFAAAIEAAAATTGEHVAALAIIKHQLRQAHALLLQLQALLGAAGPGSFPAAAAAAEAGGGGGGGGGDGEVAAGLRVEAAALRDQLLLKERQLQDAESRALRLLSGEALGWGRGGGAQKGRGAGSAPAVW
jgi:hypothetical protein